MEQKLLARGLLSVCAYVFLGIQTANAAVGTTPGTFDVTSSGAASYEIPITVPPGTGGMEPNLSLRYSSRSGNGLLGVGWSLSGLSRITRCPATYAQDGFIDAADFDDNDRLCLDGERLIPISGQYGMSGTEYRTEIEQFVKVRQEGGNLNSGSVTFKVWTKNGLVKEYGVRNSSSFDVPGRSYTYLWSVNRVSDTAGNYIEFTYTKDTDTNEHYIERIDYTGNAQAGLSPYNSVHFDYEDRPDRGERYVVNGSEKIESTRRVVSIKTYADSSKVREYLFSYIESATSGRSLLASIQECATDAIGLDCTPKTEFEWTQASAGFTEYEALELPFDLWDSDGRPRGTIIDVNNDGRGDAVQAYGGNRSTWLNTLNFDGEQSWQRASAEQLPASLFTCSGKRRAQLIDVNGDGYPDLVEGHEGSGRTTYIKGESGWSVDDSYKLPRPLWLEPFEYTEMGKATGAIRDVNGDGLRDLVISYNGLDEDIAETYLNRGTDCSGTSCNWERAPEYDLPHERMFVDIYNSNSKQGGWLRDLNGDGLPEYILAHMLGSERTYLNTGAGWEEVTNYQLPAPMTFTRHGQNISKLEDVNGDGLPDVVCSIWVGSSSSSYCGAQAVTSQVDDTFYFHRATYINTGDGFVYDLSYNLPVPEGVVGSTQFGLFQDLTGDGRPEFVQSYSTNTYIAGRKTFRTTLVNNHSNNCASESCKWEEESQYELPFYFFNRTCCGSNNDPTVRTKGRLGHFNLDGQIDFAASGHESNHKVYVASTDDVKVSSPPDLVQRVDSGALAAAVGIDYTTLLDSRQYTSGNADYPEQSVSGSYPVVAFSSREGEASGDITVRYEYQDLRISALGRGRLGFREFKALNFDTGITEITELAQSFPFTGMVLASSSAVTEYYELPDSPPIPIAEYPLAQSINTHAVDEFGSGSSKRFFPYIAVSNEQFFDVNDATTPLTTTRTETTYDNFGNATQVVQKQFQGASPGVDTHTTVTTSQYTNDTSQWLLGRLTQSTVTKTGPDGDSVTRETAFEYDAVTGLLTAEITEPNDPDLRHRTDYQYDAFGNQTEVTVSGTDIESRTTITTWDSRGQFKTSVTNALGHTESYTHSQRHGGRTSLTGPNNLTTTWTYDAFGREVQRTAPDGTTVTTSYEQCGTSCPASEGVFAIRTTGSDGSESLEVFDRFERTVLEAERGYDGSWIDVVTQYDNRDRKIAETAPHYRGAEKHWTTYEYDDHDRVVRTESPTNQDSSGGLVTEIVYDGLIVRQIDANGKVSEKHENAAGRVVKVVDALNNTTEYDYDPYGNKTRVTDAAGNITTITYDKLGRKIAMSDPDMGDWTYEYDVLGNLVEQTDANDQTMQLVYDKLGRRVTRKENPEEVTVTLPCPPQDLLCILLGGNGGTQTTTEWEETTWTYDTAWVGELAEEALPEGFERSYVYDGLGRVQDVITVIDGQTYTVSRTYDGQSRLEKLTYPSGFAVQHHYTATGYLDQITDDDTGQTYWQLDHRDAFGNVELASYGNGHSTVRNHDNARGHIDAILTGTTPGTEIQSLNYEWDKVGNLLSRIDQNQNGLTEEFEYDDLYRLTGSTLNGSTNLSVTYDEVGNITSKSGVGSYSYGAGSAGPHAVTQITGNRAATYSYDANGNMTEGDGRTLTWTSFNKPASIDKGSAHSSFRYDPDRARYKHVREREEDGQLVNATIHYVGDLYERHHEGTGFDEKHYIRAGGEAVAMQIHRSNGTQDTHYLHKDHLGSITAITDAGGNVVERYAFDAFGKRRGLAWDPDSSDSLLYLTVQVLDRGYTGHEHLDHVGLIHMNGRVYDPVIGRFVSADSFVQMPESTQGLNRYTYVQNNPLSYVDPSGHFFSAIVGAIAAAISAVATAAATAATAVATFVATHALQLGVIGLGIATDNPTLTSIGFALMPGGNFLESATLGFGAGLATTGDVETAAIAGLTAGTLSEIGTAEAFLSKEAVGKAVQRGLVGGVSAEFQGGKFQDGFLSVGSASILSPGMDTFESAPGKIAAASAISGTAAELGGGKFANGAATAAYFQTAIELPRIYKNTVGYKLDIRPGGKAVQKTELSPPVKGANNIGVQGGPINDPCFGCEGGEISQILNIVPGVNAVAGFHDAMQVSLGTGRMRDMLNFPGMVPAAAITYGGFVGQALQPLNSQKIFHLSTFESFDDKDDRRNLYSAAAVGSR